MFGLNMYLRIEMKKQVTEIMALIEGISIQLVK